MGEADVFLFLSECIASVDHVRREFRFTTAHARGRLRALAGARESRVGSLVFLSHGDWWAMRRARCAVPLCFEWNGSVWGVSGVAVPCGLVGGLFSWARLVSPCHGDWRGARGLGGV